ncbi:hypothetical protein [Streptomyces sp. e14]|uniref:hypothetical protein n=1 Tax=Streptomyces sp. e14 TaxID=645465 RepID=UPI0002F03C5D|nr:hypothetical protein [Streptomyces sp. e14]
MWSSGGVSFTPAGRDGLSPGQVRYDSVSQDGGASAVTVSMARFGAEACHGV